MEVISCVFLSLMFPFPTLPVTDIVLGLSQSLHFFSTLLQVRHEIPLAYLLIYALGNLMLQALSWFWWGFFELIFSPPFSFLSDGRLFRFYKMIISIRKRFNNPPVNQTQGPNNHKIASTLTVNGNGRHPIGNGGSI